jgi:hypothetical protein
VTLHVYTVDDGKGCSLRVHTRLLMVLNLLYDVVKSYVKSNA